MAHYLRFALPGLPLNQKRTGVRFRASKRFGGRLGGNDMKIEITGYGQLAERGAPFRVVQTGEQIGRRLPTVAARAVAFVRERDWLALRRLWNRSKMLRISTGAVNGRLHVSYGSAGLAVVHDDRLWLGMGGGRALEILNIQVSP